MAFSDETKRSVWMMVFTAIVIAMIGGTLAMWDQIFGDNSAAVPELPHTSTLAQPSGPVPDEVTEWFAEDLGTLGHPYPEGLSSPQVSQLLPQVQGSAYITSTAQTITLEVPSTYVDEEAKEGETTYAIYRRGDVAYLEALWWRCDWVETLVEAEESGDTSTVTTAREQLEAFPDLEALAPNPSVAKNHEDELSEVLAGDTEAGRLWLAQSCGR